jgi:hypothetical protein
MNVPVIYLAALATSWIGAFVIHAARSPQPFFTAIREADMSRHFAEAWRREGFRALRHPELASYSIAVFLFVAFFVLAIILLVRQELAT